MMMWDTRDRAETMTTFKVSYSRCDPQPTGADEGWLG